MTNFEQEIARCIQTRRADELRALVTSSPLEIWLVGQALALLGFEREALRRTESIPHDTLVALTRGEWAMRVGELECALDCANRAIEIQLAGRMTIDELIHFARQGATADSLLRFGSDATARLRELSEPYALRWAALHRLGRTTDALAMQELCARFWPGRASVWATAGNHALDRDSLPKAEEYFQRCLRLAPKSIAGLAGIAIVRERQKDWAAALPYRRAVVEHSGALERDDAASLQRTIRFAAALGRVERWHEAGPLARRCVRAGAYTSLPRERLVLLRIFSRALRAPAMLITMLAPSNVSAFEALDEEELAGSPRGDVLSGLADAVVLARVQPPAEELEARGIWQWLAGDSEAAFALLDQADDDTDDARLHYLLLRTAIESQSSDRASIRDYAIKAARRALHSESDEQRFYASLILEEPPPDLPDAESRLAAWCVRASLDCARSPGRRPGPLAFFGQESETPDAVRSTLELELASRFDIEAIRHALEGGELDWEQACSLALFSTDYSDPNGSAEVSKVLAALAPASASWTESASVVAARALACDVWAPSLARTQERARDYDAFRLQLEVATEQRGPAATRLRSVLRTG